MKRGWIFSNFTVAIAILLTGGFATPGHAASVVPMVELDHSHIEAGKEAVVHVLVDFKVAKIAPDKEKSRPPLNLALVLDRSGSMEDRGKLEYAKKAANTLVDLLKPTDRLAVVEYDDQITVLWPSAPVSSPDMIKRRIGTLTPRGSTNLTGGMMKGVDEVLSAKEKAKEALNRVILMSDGLANQGVTHPAEIARLVREARGKGVRITTMGLGRDYDEDLMTAIAENSGGHYYYIESPQQMARVYQQEMSVLMTMVTKDVKFDLQASPAVTDVKVYGFPAETRDGVTKVSMEDFYAEETRTLLFQFKVAARNAGEWPVAKLVMNYEDLTSGTTEKLTSEIKVTATGDPIVVAQNENKEVAAEAALVHAEEEQEKYVRLYEQGDTAGALAGMKQLADAVKQQNAQFNDARLAKKAEALEMESGDLNRAAAAPAVAANYLKQRKQQFYLAKQGKRGKYMMQSGDKGFDVERLQEALAKEGFYKGAIDGEYDDDVVVAVKAFQKDRKLTDDGIAGPATLRELKIY